MVMKSTQYAEGAHRDAAKRETMADPYPRSVAPSIGGLNYRLQTALEDVEPNDFRFLSDIPGLSRQALLVHADNNFVMLVRYACHGEFFWGITVDALFPRVWRETLAVDPVDLRCCRKLVARSVWHIKDI